MLSIEENNCSILDYLSIYAYIYSVFPGKFCVNFFSPSRIKEL